MTEEEWFEKKKQIKYLRERLRKAKITNQLKEIAENEKMLNAAISETTVEKVDGKNTTTNNNNNKTTKVDTTENISARNIMLSKVKQGKPSGGMEARNGEASTKSSNNKNGTKAAPSRDIAPTTILSSVAGAVPGGMIPAMFVRDIHWTPHQYDSSESDSPYDSTCPKGGPGGLICCEDCTKSYSRFLTATSKDLEEQRTRKVSNEVQELLEILNSARSKLNGALRTAKQQSVSEKVVTMTRTLGKSPANAKGPFAPSQAKQIPGQPSQQPEHSFQFDENPLTLQEALDAGVAQLPPMQPFELDPDTSPDTVAV